MNLEGKNRTTCDGMIRLTNATKETLAITANWTSWIRCYIDNA